MAKGSNPVGLPKVDTVNKCSVDESRSEAKKRIADILVSPALSMRKVMVSTGGEDFG